MHRLRQCDRKQFKLLLEGGGLRVTPDGYAAPVTSSSPGGATLLAVLAAVALAVLAWLWLVKPAIERRWMTPRFLGHYLLYPADGVEASPRPLEEDPEPPGTTTANADNAGLFNNHPWRARANARREPLPSANANANTKANAVRHPYLTDVPDSPAAMVPALDAAGAPLALDAGATMADIREAVKESGARVIGLLRQGGVIRVFRPRDGGSWAMYGQADEATDHTVAVFSLPRRQWWWQVVEGPTFE